MLALHSGDVWTQLQGLRKGRAKLLTAVAYITDDSVMRFREGDILVTDASDAAIRNGVTSARVLQRALRRGALLFSVPNLHAKVVCTTRRAIIGSANFSQSSRNRLLEAAVVSDRPEIVAAAIQFIHKLRGSAQVIDRAFVSRALAIPVKRQPFEGIRNAKKRVNLSEGRTWLMGLSSDKPYPGDLDSVDMINDDVADLADNSQFVDWFWMSGSRSRFIRLARVGDRIVSIVRPREKDRSARGVRVYEQAVLLKIYQEPRTNLWSYHYADPADSEATSLTWRQFVSLVRQVGMRVPKVSSVRELRSDEAAALHELWPR